jgi:hypothetical protein
MGKSSCRSGWYVVLECNEEKGYWIFSLQIMKQNFYSSKLAYQISLNLCDIILLEINLYHTKVQMFKLQDRF